MLQMTVEHFGEGVLPKEVFISATADEGSNVFNACQDLGIITIPCRGDQLNSAVMCALGLTGSVQTRTNGNIGCAVGDDGGANRCKSEAVTCGPSVGGGNIALCKNADMRKLVGKAAALLGKVCGRNGVRKDALHNGETGQQMSGNSEGIGTRSTEEQLEVGDHLLRRAELLEGATAEQSHVETPSTPGNNSTRGNDIRCVLWAKAARVAITPLLRIEPVHVDRNAYAVFWLGVLRCVGLRGVSFCESDRPKLG